MKVIDLIIALQNCDPNKEVFFDVTKEGMDMWKMCGVNFCDEVGTGDMDIILLSRNGVSDENEN